MKDYKDCPKLIKIKPLIRYFYFFTTLLFCVPLVSFTNNSNLSSYRIKTIVIDAGHGGRDGATQGVYSREKDVALKVALLLGKTIEAEMKDVKVIYTRKTDEFIELYERIDIANRNKADLFISIHCNDMPVVRRIAYYKTVKGKRVPVYTTSKNTAARGVETFVSGSSRLKQQDAAIRENASILLEKNYKDNYSGYDPGDPASIVMLSLMKNAYRDQSIRLATYIQNEYVKKERVDRGVQELNLAVLAKAGMPAVLTEIGFISNPTEEDYINSAEGQNEIVDCLLNAIKTYKKLYEGE